MSSDSDVASDDTTGSTSHFLCCVIPITVKTAIKTVIKTAISANGGNDHALGLGHR